jgi:polygalacturonase
MFLIQSVGFVSTCHLQGGEGYAKSISFTDIEFINVENPVVINQFYRDDREVTQSSQSMAVAISDITYARLRGTSSQPTAVSFECGTADSCTGIHVNNMRITGPGGGAAVARCQNAEGDASGYVYPAIPCLK